MTDLTIIEKYPPGHRIEHPDFGDVCKTTFARGVITDIEKLQDDPIQAKSRVKVDIGGDEWLPLFFHQKAQYWDPDSQKFADQYFEKAWMSFRAEDQVAIMPKEGTPVAVLGFADGVPRIGEDIIQFETISPFRWRMSVNQQYQSSSGPDGLALKLDLEAEKIADKTDSQDQISDLIVLSNIATLQTAVEDYNFDGPFYWREGIKKVYTRNITTTHQELIYNNKYQIHLMKVGPILYLILALFRGNYHTKNYSSSQTPDPTWSRECAIYDFKNFPGWILMHYNDCDGADGNITAGAEAEVAAINYSNPPLNPSSHEPVTVNFKIYAAIYSEKLYKDTKNNPPVWDFVHNVLKPDPPEGFILQSAGVDIDYSLDNKVNSKVGMKYHIRPHTKEELQAAGMWPGD